MSESVSLQHTVMRTHAAEKVYQLERQHPETEQHRFSLELERRDLEDQQRIPASPRSEGGRIDRESERRKEQRRRQGGTSPAPRGEGGNEDPAPIGLEEQDLDARGRFVDCRA